MPALIPVDNTLGALLIGAVLSSMIYGVTWLQVYSYYNTHCSRDRWHMKSFVAFLMLIDTTNIIFVVHTTYHYGVTNFGDYQANILIPWSLPSIALTGFVLEVSVEHFYAYRIYRLSRGSPYLPAAISAVSLTSFGIGLLFSVKVMEYLFEPGRTFQGLCIATLACKVLCDILITFGMVYSLLCSRTQVRRTNNVLNHLAIYAINCGTLNLVFAISCLTLLAKYGNTSLYAPSFFIIVRLHFCAFMSILNSRDNLRETLNGPEGVVTSFNHLKPRKGITVPCVQVRTETSTNEHAVSKARSLQPVSVSSDASFSDSVIAFNREKYPVPPVPGVLTV